MELVLVHVFMFMFTILFSKELTQLVVLLLPIGL